MSLSNKMGPPVEGDDFYGREREIRIASSLLDAKNSLLLAAPRRIGKTSFAKRMISEKEKLGWKCVYIDLEGLNSEDEFLEELIVKFNNKGIWKQVIEGISRGITSLQERIDKVNVGPVSFNLGRKEEKENMYKDLKELIRHEEDIFIVVDELALFLSNLNRNEEKGTGRVSYILNWLRSLRQVSKTKVRWMFCGSVGLTNFTSANNLSHTINDLTRIHLDELCHDEAAGLFAELCKSHNIEMSEELIEYALHKLYWNIPYFIQIIFFKLVESHGESIDIESIDSAYNELCSETYLSTWSERLIEYQEYEKTARAILKLLSTRHVGLERELLLDYLMTDHDAMQKEEVDYVLSRVLEMLENDGYIMRQGSVRTFRSPILRDYWFLKFAQ